MRCRDPIDLDHGPMPIPTPFHARTSALCTSLFWKEWAGYHAVRSYATTHDREYFAIRHSAALIDVTPLYKYEVRGPGAADFLSYVTVRDINALREGRVTYLCWCDDDGQVIDDGTVTRLDAHLFRATAAEPALGWFLDLKDRFDVEIRDTTEEIAALSLQGPRSRAILEDCAGSAIGTLRFFRLAEATIDGAPVQITRTGYTGDLGFEIWMRAADALRVWDAVMESGRPHRIEPTGLDAMDVARIEAGFIMNGVDYFSAHHCLVDSRKSSPYELGLDWTVKLEREPFVGQAALRRERREGPKWRLTGLAVDWPELEALFARFGLPPKVPSCAWRDPVPVYDARGAQVGYATSGAWSPTLKRSLALATLKASHAQPGTRVRIEVTAEFARHRVGAEVVPTPFFDPERKRA